MLKNVLFVAIGGGLGAVVRYLMGFCPLPEPFFLPTKTLLINIIGAILIGMLSVLFEGLFVSGDQRIRLLTQVGFCGGFTTFSTFSLEMFQLLDNGKAGVAFAYALLSVVLTLLGVMLGRWLVTLCFGSRI